MSARVALRRLRPLLARERGLEPGQMLSSSPPPRNLFPRPLRELGLLADVHTPTAMRKREAHLCTEAHIQMSRMRE